MNSAASLARLRRLKLEVIETADAAAALDASVYAASKTLSRLAAHQLITPLRHGVWWIDGEPDPYRLLPYLTAPYPSYFSLQTALHIQGVIEQIPSVFYAVSLARTQTIVTTLGVFSVHRIAPDLFGGFAETTEGIAVASAEKALFDLAYLSGGRTRAFKSVPEIALPAKFRNSEVRRWIARIASPRLKTITSKKIEQWIKSDLRAARTSRSARARRRDR